MLPQVTKDKLVFFQSQKQIKLFLSGKFTFLWNILILLPTAPFPPAPNNIFHKLSIFFFLSFYFFNLGISSPQRCYLAIYLREVSALVCLSSSVSTTYCTTHNHFILCLMQRLLISFTTFPTNQRHTESRVVFFSQNMFSHRQALCLHVMGVMGWEGRREAGRRGNRQAGKEPTDRSQEDRQIRDFQFPGGNS